MPSQAAVSSASPPITEGLSPQQSTTTRRHRASFPRPLSGTSLRSALGSTKSRSREDFQRRMDTSESSASSTSSSSLENLCRRSNKIIRAESIVQRSSSKTVKSTLMQLKDLDASAAPPMKELAMLSNLATDSFYRVILIKSHGKDIIAKVQEQFAGSRACQDACRRVLSLLEQPNNDKTFLETTKGVTSTPKRRWRGSVAENEFSKLVLPVPSPPLNPDDEDILEIINRECRLMVETSRRLGV
eukprot:CAMPEP_0117040554 /NCGR_PEP_ID=MMETSP0472-20121206/28371_1 /TAXON_ID=693140 ORGANISM="Tiarina fusus, Strain LIS" /NCGR_SAMPLE_ID=MMETSP0472 /ASSEMBLY_ACC=CAM_ASM_000603 /LENGTH=243 /DNA_ID=CAMNT_0004751313 /DNA_START=96 /DNA_END=827 /DNA_ORIENTATION=-